MSLHLFLETLDSTASACSGNRPNAGIRLGKGRNVDTGRVGVRIRVPLLQVCRRILLLFYILKKKTGIFPFKVRGSGKIFN